MNWQNMLYVSSRVIRRRLAFKAADWSKDLVSLVVLWLRMCLPRQGAQLPSLVSEPRSHTLWDN